MEEREMKHSLAAILAAATAGTVLLGVVSAPTAAAAAPPLPSDVTQLSTPFVDPRGSNFVVTRSTTNTLLIGRRDPVAPVRGVTALGNAGGSLQGDPQGVTIADVGIRVFARDTSNQVVTNLFPNGAPQTGFQVVPGLLVSSDVEVVDLSGAGGQLVRIFARGLDDGAVYTNLLTTAGFTGWRSLGGFTTSEISAALTGNGDAFRVVVRDAGWRVSTTVLSSDGSTTGWAGIGGPEVRGNIALSGGNQAGVQPNEIFLQDAATRTVMTYTFDQPGWRNLGGIANSDIAVLALFDGSVEFLVRGTTNNLYVNRRAPGATNFIGYVNLGGILTGNPGIGATFGRDPAAYAYVRGTNQRLFNKFQRSNFDFDDYIAVSSIPTA
ncbi:hypothetical protein [Actinoplanes sp. NPDC049118]|uniref:hypothetical protein n=1 Tax=Actinoplanes sp. NPDC049118 TaxID=3155769 RepID=UPI00340AF28A